MSKIAVKGKPLYELADFMLSQGCHWAINLDGGGSSGLYYQQEMKTSSLFDHAIYGDFFLREIHTAIIVK